MATFSKMKNRFWILLYFVFFLLFSCSNKTCEIDFDLQKDLFENVVNSFAENEPPIPGQENHSKSIILHKHHLGLDTNLFSQVDLIEYYYLDKTFIFQAPICSNSILENIEINMVIYSKLEIGELRIKRNFKELKQREGKWYEGIARK